MSCPETLSPAAGASAAAVPQQREWHWAWGIIAVLTLLQLVVGGIVSLDGDETYYWEWSRHLAPGYFDHPPAIAFLIRAGRFIAGDTPLGVRLFSIVANTGAMLLVILLARRLAGGKAAFRAALALVALPIVSVWLLLATPDPIMGFANAAALYAVVRAVQNDAGSRTAVWWWALAGLALGLSLQSKEMAILLPVGVLVAMILHPSLRPRLKEPGPYLACGLALVIFSPAILWNAEHHWPFAFQVNHGFGTPRDSLLSRQASLLGSQFAVASGILFVMLTMATVRALRVRESPVRFLLATVTATTFGLFVLSAFRRMGEANWPAAGYTSAVVLLATLQADRKWNRWLGRGYALGLLLVALAYLHMIVPVFKRHSGGDLVRRGYGWDTIASRVETVRERTAAASTGRVWLAGNTYQDASEIAFHLADHPPVFALNLASRTNQYALWPQFSLLASRGDHLVFVRTSSGEIPRAVEILRPHFEQVEWADRVEPTMKDPELPARGIWVMRGWKGTWPGVDTTKR